VHVWVAHETQKVLPSARPPEGQAAAIGLELAGADCAGAQVVISADEGLQGLTAEAAPLEGAGASIAVSIARVATIQLIRPSGPEGRAGEWPDALIPTRDALFGEARKAFPIDLAARRAQAIFVEACTQAGAAAGRYSGNVRLVWTQAGKAASATIAISARVRAFDLPATPPLVTAFGFSGYSAAKGHGLPASMNAELTRRYDLLALRRGLTLFGGTQDAPSHRIKGDEVTIDWRDYDAEVAPFLDGTALKSGARWSAVELREPGKLTRAQRRSYRKAWMAHFEQRGWLDRLFVYVHDEPAEKLFGKVESKAAEVRADLPKARRLVTTAVSEKLPSVDLWTPLLNCFEPGSGDTCPRPATRDRYAPALRGGAKLWWYQSCASHGCDKEPATDRAYLGWPSYAIDADATGARAMATLAYAHSIAGELYYNVVMSYEGTDPWSDPWQFGGNGDGTLYYPGTPARIGGSKDVPVETLRLIEIARGLGDHAALSLVSQLGDADLARREANQLAPSIRNYSRDPAAYSGMRSRLYDRIEALMALRKPRAERQ